MKSKTSITLSPELLHAIDQLPERHKSRSAFLEKAAWALIARLQREEQGQRDSDILNRQAKYLNEEVLDALAYQVSL